MPAAGDSAVTQVYYELGIVKKVVLTVAFDSGDGSFTATALTTRLDGFLHKIVTDPGSTAPTDNYDVTLLDDEGVDVLQTTGENRDTANTETAHIVYSGTTVHPCVSQADTLTLTITGNSQTSATTVITIYYSAMS